MHFIKTSLATLLSAVLVLPAAAIQISTPQTASALVQKLLNDPQACTAGSAFTNCSYTGAGEAVGIFSDGSGSGFEIDSGILLSSGKVADAVGPNFSDGKTTAFNLPGDVDLNALSATGDSRDAAVLEFDFLAQGQTLTFQYIFASEEYNEFTNSDFRDVFGFFLNDTADPTNKSNLTTVSVNNINKNSNTAQFVNNDFKDFNQVAPLDTEYDGFTRLIEASATLTPGNSYHMKMAIADVRDSGFDSAVLIKGFSTVPPEIQVTEQGADRADGSTVDFGSTPEGTPLVKTLTFSNSQAGAAALSLSNLLLPAGFTLLDALPTELAAGSSVAVRVQFAASNSGSFSGRFSVTNNDADENPFDLTLTAQATRLFPQVRMNNGTQVLANAQGLLDFGTSTQGQQATVLTVNLENVGTGVLNIGSATLAGATQFALLNAPSGSLAPGATLPVQIRLNTDTEGSFNGTFTLLSDDPTNTRYLIRLVGTVQAIPVAPQPPAIPVTTAEPIPTLSETALWLLSLLLFGIAARRLRWA